ncbi:MAG: YicC/YloC family endoribonuclease [Parvularculaceae bacterium]
MTGFARAEGEHKGWRFVWEARSVNGRNLEMRSRLPAGFDALEPSLREAVKGKLARGTVNITLTLAAGETETKTRINEAMLADVIAMIEKIRLRIECAPPQPEGVLAIRGVVETDDDIMDEAARKALHDALMKSFAAVLDGLAAARAAEGASLSGVLAGQFSEIERLTGEAGTSAAAAPAAIRDRFAAQLKELLEGALPEERLAQEAALLAIRADVREEIDRLTSHIAAGRALIARGGAAGRELDFLIQECNREANTLCSKAPDMELKRIGLELKRVIDQVREQVQNIE